MARKPKPENMSQQASPARDEHGHFLPGTSGNPGGRPPVAKEIRDLAQADSPEAYLKVQAIMRTDGHKHQLAAAVAILKMAGVSMNADEAPSDSPPQPSAPVTDAQIRDRLGVN